MDYLYSDITGRILRAAMNVHGFLGNGFPEIIYQRALQIEFDVLKIKSGKEVVIPVYYHNILIGERRVDFLVENIICVELKAIGHLENNHFAQAKNYLEAFNLQIGLLINFGATSLEWKRIFNNKYKHATIAEN